MKEQWKPIEGYSGYELSNHGRVWGYYRNKLLKPLLNSGGYLQVELWKNGRGKRFLIARLVAEAFIPNPKNLATVNHIDEIKTNNHINNLEWMSNANNIRYSQCRPVLQIDRNTSKIIKEHEGVCVAARSIGKPNRGIDICKVCQGNRTTAYGYKWEYKNE